MTWTGDNDATWAQLKLGVAQTLNLGQSGFTYTAVDVGGFLGAPSPELLTRWFQVQASLPLMRDHTATGTPPQEPWVHGPEHEALRRHAVEERHRLLPTFYALADEARRTGAPIVRPVFYDHPALLDAPRDMSMAFTLGANLLVAGSPTPGSPAPYEICLPDGRWFDYWTGTELLAYGIGDGPHRAVREAPRVDRLPVYVREGTILVRQALVRSLAEAPDGPLELDIWPGADGHATLYDDDGHSMAHARGVHLRQRVRHQASAGGLALAFEEREGSYEPPWSALRVTVHGWVHPTAWVGTPDAKPVAARVEGTTARFVIPAPTGRSPSASPHPLPLNEPSMTDALPTIAALYRYPVKGLSPQAEARLAVTAAAGLADDRRFALALGTTLFDPEAPQPLEKGHFLMLQRNEALAALSTRYEGGTLSIAAPRRDGLVPSLSADLATPAGRDMVEGFFDDYVGEASKGGARLVEAADHKFTDVSHLSAALMKAVSVVNLASVRDLARRTGLAIDPLRFRANIYLEGLPAWAEMDWLDHDVAIGSARFRCVRLTRRCAAIDVDPATGARDMNLTKALVSHYGHPYCGVYLEVVGDGAFDLGTTVVRPSASGAPA